MNRKDRIMGELKKEAAEQASGGDPEVYEQGVVKVDFGDDEHKVIPK